MTSRQTRFVTVDVFTNKCFKGNQLAVVDTTKKELSSQDMQAMAREFNFSETVFLDQRDGIEPPRVHIFTPVNEMNFAGHPVIGTGHVLFRRLLPSASETMGNEARTLSIKTKAGMVPITYDPDSQTVTADVPHDVHVHSHETPKQHILDTQPDFAAEKESQSMAKAYPTVSIVKGVTYVLVDLSDLPELFTTVKTGNSPVLTLDSGWAPSFAGTMFYKITGTQDRQGTKVQSLRVRMIAINLEDPACGSGCCSLAAYLALQDGSRNGTYQFHFNQGSEIGRDSSLTVDVLLNSLGSGVSSIRLSGQVALVTEGTTVLP